MVVMKYEPGKRPEVVDVVPIGPVTQLRAFQAVVGGYIEQLGFHGDMVILCDEEARLKNSPYNRWNVLGTFIICRLKNGEWASLTDEDVNYLKRRVL